ncbi:GAF and ANTAR domain-containing protein [Williamsia sterculiae]|uniref:GAF domain-containing protein n=1 Tax=Williamsia sterculiae TaxID=1344003 RepID=A0A1N7CCC3_9NOCA|nr:GAF domain-containing protein [Williamsia sterculiae]
MDSPQDEIQKTATAEITVALPARMASVARLLRQESRDSPTILRAISASAVQSIPGAEYASVTLVGDDSELASSAIVGDLAAESDRLQAELNEGPCIRAALDSDTISIERMATETRWPEFSARAAEIGIGSMLCFCLYVEGDNFASLNLHSSATEAFDDDSRSVGGLFAAHAAIALSTVREKERVRASLTQRDLIGQAKGMIMERFRLGHSDAFELLARLSRERGVTLSAVAAQIIEAGPGA